MLSPLDIYVDPTPDDTRPARTADDLRIRRVPVADRRDPARPAPIELAWHERTCSVAAPGHFVFEIPYVGGPPPVGVDPVLTGDLQQQWYGRAGEWAVTGVTAAFRHTGRRTGFLSLAVTGAPTTPEHARLDGVAMARDLQAALRRR